MSDASRGEASPMCDHYSIVSSESNQTRLNCQTDGAAREDQTCLGSSESQRKKTKSTRHNVINVTIYNNVILLFCYIEKYDILV